MESPLPVSAWEICPGTGCGYLSRREILHSPQNILYSTKYRIAVTYQLQNVPAQISPAVMNLGKRDPDNVRPCIIKLWNCTIPAFLVVKSNRNFVIFSSSECYE